ncbi:Bug family tripartite tricarboxylate transporter substrate binding protein [Paracoccus sp. (in: a-proteobacteria)]|uniref:Bug family tripartite tricarboxylate transporter substrate binding protein n=1 Tax=Paracoccus sp. TaxID=267 RepID=UPI002AFE8345|nr:tripartite tricarboxylate transporter substrate-binding protein [Paracoccus sp. (in: a-proteobacteria)]
MKSILKAMAAAAALVAPGLAMAQSFPDKPVRLIIPYSAGASNDLLGRYLADSLGKIWGQPVMVENIPGAGGALGIAAAARSEPDGYNLLWASSTFSPTAAANPNLPFDFATDLTPINKVGEGELLAITGTRVPIRTVDELIQKSKEQTIFFAGTGPASIPSFMGTLMNGELGIEMEGVNYKGGSEAILDLVAGRVDLYVGTITSTQAMINEGTAFPLVMLGKERSTVYPDVPTIVEAGYPGAAADIWWGVFGPAGMGEELVTKIHDDISTVMAAPETLAMFETHGARPVTMPQPEFVELVTHELARWKALVEKYGITVD